MPHAAVIQSYTVRIPGHCFWREGIADIGDAREEQRCANVREPGHQIYAHWSDGSVTDACEPAQTTTVGFDPPEDPE